MCVVCVQRVHPFKIESSLQHMHMKRDRLAVAHARRAGPPGTHTCKCPGQMIGKVGSGSSGDCFNLKGAEWADVKTGSLEANVRVQAHKRPKYAAIAARASTSCSAPDLELPDDAGS